MIIIFFAQAAMPAPPPPPPRPNADFVCRLLDDKQQQSILRGRVRLSGQSWDNQVSVDVIPESQTLPAVSGYGAKVYGNLFNARFFSDTREVHYDFQLPEASHKNGNVRVFNVEKPQNGQAPRLSWVATGLCDFVLKAVS